MTEGSFQIQNRLGLHARAAARLVNLSASFQCEVWVGKDDQRVNAKSIMGVLLLCGHPGAWLRIEADGPDEARAVREIGELINNRFDEGE